MAQRGFTTKSSKRPFSVSKASLASILILTVVGTAQSIYGSVTFNLTMPTSLFGFGISPFGLRPFGDPVPV